MKYVTLACDRCGKAYEKDEISLDVRRFKTSFTLWRPKEKLYRLEWDLCDECGASLKLWMETKS